MTEEEQKAADLAAAEEAEKAEAERVAGLSEEERKAEQEAKVHSQPDYETLLKEERERREAAEKAAADAAFKLRERKRQEDEGEDEDDEDKPVTARQLQSLLASERQHTLKEVQATVIAEKARKLSSSDAEAALIVEIHKNRTFPEGLSLDEQVEEAFAIANRKKLIAENSELKRALRGKDGVSTDTATTHRTNESEEPKTSSNDISALKAAGFVWDGKANAWKKETAGRITYVSKDLKTKRTVPK